jgi:hypothetical protein
VWIAARFATAAGGRTTDLRASGCASWDALSDGRRFRILAIVDDFTRECVCLVADTSLPGLKITREPDAIVVEPGRPLLCVSDNDAEPTSMTLEVRLQHRAPACHLREARRSCNATGGGSPRLIGSYALQRAPQARMTNGLYSSVDEDRWLRSRLRERWRTAARPSRPQR